MKSKFVLLLLMTIAALLIFAPTAALAQEPAQVTMERVAEADGIVTVDVIAKNVADLYGVELLIQFDSAVVTVQDQNAEQQGVQISSGNFPPAEQGFVVANQVDNDGGNIIYAMTLLNPAPPVSGEGVIARLTFVRQAEGPTTLNIADIKLVSVGLQIIPVETSPLQLPDAAGVIPAPAADADAGFPWWLVAVAIMAVGVVGLGAFIALGGVRQGKSSAPTRPKTTAAATTNDPTVNPVPRQPSQDLDLLRQPQQPKTRPSAFK